MKKKLKGDPLGTWKNFPIKFFKMRCKRGTLWDFLTSIVLQNIETNEGGTLWCNPKSFKKSHRAEKKWGYGGILSVISRFWTCVLFFLFVMDALLRLELRFDVVEQMNKKVDLTRLKKLPTVRVGTFSTKMRRLKNIPICSQLSPRNPNCYYMIAEFTCRFDYKLQLKSITDKPGKQTTNQKWFKHKRQRDPLSRIGTYSLIYSESFWESTKHWDHRSNGENRISL